MRRAALVIAFAAGCGADPVADDSCEPPAPLASRVVVEVALPATTSVLAVVDRGDQIGLVLREARGDRMSLCPDCNTTPICPECAHDVVLYRPAPGAPDVEIDRWFLGSPYDSIFAGAATVTATGEIAIAWQRRRGASGLSPSEARFTRIAADGSAPAPSLVLYPSSFGRLRLYPHPTRPEVLALRDSDVLLARAGVTVSIVPLDGSPAAWTQIGSSLAFAATATPLRDGFAVAFSDQYGTETDPNCTPCATLAECFPDGTIDPTEELPSTGCFSYFEASPAGGLQTAVVTTDGAGPSIQLASGWYDRVYQGEDQRLYSDHHLTNAAPGPAGFALVSEWVDDSEVITRWLDIDLAADEVVETRLPIDYVAEGTSPFWFAQAVLAGEATAFVGNYHSAPQLEDSRQVVEAFQRTDGCVTREAVVELAGDARAVPGAGRLLLVDGTFTGTVRVTAIEAAP